MIDISVVIPIRDEASNLHALTDSIVQVLESASISFEIIYVTDLNKDDTQGVLINLCMNDMRVKAIKLANSFGQHVAVIAGLRACVGRNAIIMDGDLQDSPSDIPKLYDKLREGFDVVYGIRGVFTSRHLVWRQVKHQPSRDFSPISHGHGEMVVKHWLSVARRVSWKPVRDSEVPCFPTLSRVVSVLRKR
jgi:glycosyltransferase involved in cell wall biosynthesis